MQANLVRSTRWLALSLLGLVAGWLIVAKAFAPGGLALLLGKKPGALPEREGYTIHEKTRSADDPDPSPTIATPSPKPGSAAKLACSKLERLPASALAEAGLTEADRPVAEARIAAAWETMGRAVAERMRQEGDPEKGGYFIPADKAAGDAVLVDLRRSLRESFGREAADKLLGAMDLEAYFAAFGRRNVTITPRGTMIELFYSDADNGRAIEATAVSPERFREIFGNAIQLPEEPASR